MYFENQSDYHLDEITIFKILYSWTIIVWIVYEKPSVS